MRYDAYSVHGNEHNNFHLILIALGSCTLPFSVTPTVKHSNYKTDIRITTKESDSQECLDSPAVSRVLVHQWLGLDPVVPQLSARGSLDASPQHGGFTCPIAQLFTALETSSREYEYRTLRRLAVEYKK